MPPGGQHVKRSRAGRGGFLRAPERRCWSPERWPNRWLEYADPRSVHPAVSPAETGEELPPGLLRGPKTDSAPGELSPPVCSGGVKEPGARAPSAETCRAHRCCLNRRGRGLSVSWDWEREAWFLKLLRVGLYFLLGAVLPFQGFSVVNVRIPNSEHSRHSSSPLQ